ncbi:leucine-rich repeat domain-containing protein [Treponema socranskii subsp. buccale]|uniref:leucine-rich repeat domain-containing protein n=1 Tax=Treponema socranskii TaxID=53419 RepID=UPI0020A5098F|nr:leucine-rich repeat domain-containing protein [Treponema socranskii]UTD03132.1 leucine-rich repeat domain-containing protein [Treponema socranskii subsp. buccale]
MRGGTERSGLLLSDDRTAVVSFIPAASIEAVDIPDSVTVVPASLFSGCASLKKIKLSASLRSIPDRLFEGCSSLEKIIMPPEIDSIGRAAFSGCSSLKSIPFRAGLTELSEDVFSYCTSLTSLIVPDTVERIKSGAAADCTKLAAVVLPSSLKTLEAGAFAGCSSLRHIRISEDNDVFYVDEKDGCLYRRKDAVIVLRPCDFEKAAAKLIKSAEDELRTDEQKNGGTPEIDRYEESLRTAEDGVEAQDVSEGAVAKFLKKSDNSDTVENDRSEISEDVPDEIEIHKFNNTEPNDVMEKKTMANIDQASVDEIFKKASEIKSENTETADDGFKPISQDELNLLVAESDILRQNTPADITASASAQEHECSVSGDSLLKRIADAAKKYECIDLSNPDGRSDWNDGLYVFAEGLVLDSSGSGHFSKALENCSRRIAAIRKYSKIFMYYGLPFGNDEFAHLFAGFIAERNTVYACSASKMSLLSGDAEHFASLAGISLERDQIECTNERAGNPETKLIKLMLQDNYSA